MNHRLPQTPTFGDMTCLMERFQAVVNSKPRHLYASAKAEDILSDKVDKKPVILKTSRKKADTDILFIEATPELLELLRWKQI